MKYLRYLFVVIAILSSSLHISSAQDNTFQCSADDLLSSVSNVEAVLTQAQTSAANGDIQAALDAFQQISGELTATQSLCRGWNFSGTSSDALGPLELDAGVYILEYAAELEDSAFVLGAFTVQFENLDEEEYVLDSVLETYDEVGIHTGRTTVRLEGGRYLVSVEPTGISSWSLNLTKP